jgi:hypothetical protein
MSKFYDSNKNYLLFAIKGPSALDFGVVCVRSMSAKNLDFLNTLDQPIHVELEVIQN